MSTNEAAERLKISRRRVLALIGSKRLAATRIGRDWTISPAALARVKDRKAGRPSRAQRIERLRETPSDFEVIDAIRKAIWKTYQTCPANLRPIVIPKFRDFLNELERTGDLSW
jgi:excisionase family DNA binding protein